MVHRSGCGEFRVPWAAIQDVRIEPDYGFIYIGPTHAFVVPKASVHAADHDAFLEEVQRQRGAARA
jgi:hypothetical protein